jgi:DNA-binding CsgD family transcriptional regulator
MDGLNTKQTEVLLLVCKGLRNSDIAKALGLKERTIKAYMAQLFLIFDVTNRTELVGLFVAGTPDEIRLHPNKSNFPEKKGKGVSGRS